jgi:DNA-binding beta-propeller fold protein YncE
VLDVSSDRSWTPNLQSHDVYVIDPQARKVVDHFRVGVGPQHVVPSWDLKTLWVTNNAEGRTDGSLTPIDTLTEVEFIKTDVGTHGLYPSRDGARPGSVAVIDFATRKIVATWPIPGGW